MRKFVRRAQATFGLVVASSRALAQDATVTLGTQKQYIRGVDGRSSSRSAALIGLLGTLAVGRRGAKA